MVRKWRAVCSDGADTELTGRGARRGQGAVSAEEGTFASLQ